MGTLPGSSDNFLVQDRQKEQIGCVLVRLEGLLTIDPDVEEMREDSMLGSGDNDLDDFVESAGSRFVVMTMGGSRGSGASAPALA